MHPIWTPESTASGITDAALTAWKKRHGRDLPALETLLRVHDGGELERLSNTWELHPLAEMKAVDTVYLEEVRELCDSLKDGREELKNSGLPPKAELFPFVCDGNHFFWFAWLDDAAEPQVTLDEAAGYVRVNPPATGGEGTVELLDFEKRNRYRWSSKGPVLSGSF